jgi:hypothetical protein
VSVISQIFPKLSFNFATKVVEALFGSENVLGTGRFAVIFFFFFFFAAFALIFIVKFSHALVCDMIRVIDKNLLKVLMNLGFVDFFLWAISVNL